MPIVLVDAPSVTTNLVGPVEPRSVQLVVTGLTPGQSLAVTGEASGVSWPVRSPAVVPAERVTVVDTATPISVPITYTVTVAGVPFEQAPVTVPYAAGTAVLQSPDGRTVVPFAWHDNGDPREPGLRSVSYAVPGRSDRPVRWDVASGEAGELVIRTSPTAVDALRSHLRSRGPVLLLRSAGVHPGLPVVSYLLVTRAPSRRFSSVGDRVWTLSVEYITDPEPSSVLVAAATPEDFDAVYASATPEDFDAQWASATPEEFDLVDWTQA